VKQKFESVIFGANQKKNNFKKLNNNTRPSNVNDASTPFVFNYNCNFSFNLNNKLADKYINFVCYYQNVRGLRTKLDILRCYCSLFDFDYCILTETLLTVDFCDTELGLTDYQLFRFDRNENTSPYRRGGGILVAIKNLYAARMLSVPINNVEQLFILVSVGNKNLIVGGVYIPPSSGPDMYDCHVQSVELLRTNYADEFNIAGDFNLSSARYEINSNSGINFSPTTVQSDSILFGYSYFNFRQFNQILNYNNSLLDLVFSSLPMLLVSLSLDPIVHIDNHHLPLIINSKLQCISNTLPHKVEFWNFKKVNFIDIIYELNKINWSLTFLNLDINTTVNKFNSICHEILLKLVPIVTYNYNSFPIWFNKELS